MLYDFIMPMSPIFYPVPRWPVIVDSVEGIESDEEGEEDHLAP